MLKTAAILAAVAAAQPLHAQNPLAVHSLRGEVKSVHAFGESGWLRVWFDPAGRITMKVSQQGEGPTVIDDDFVYDDRGRLLSFDRSRIDRGDPVPDRRRHTFSHYRNEENGRQAVYDDRGETAYEYDARGNCMLERRAGTWIIRRYDEQGRLVRRSIEYHTDENQE